MVKFKTDKVFMVLPFLLSLTHPTIDAMTETKKDYNDTLNFTNHASIYDPPTIPIEMGYQSTYNDIYTDNINTINDFQIITTFARKMIENTKPLDPIASEVLNEHYEELFL